MFASTTRNEETNSPPGIPDEPNSLDALMYRADIDQRTFDENHDQDKRFFQRAIADCSNLLALQPRQLKHMYHRSLYYFQLGRYDEALVDFKTILSSGDYTLEQKKTIISKRTKIYSMRMEWDEALQDAETLAALIQQEIKKIRAEKLTLPAVIMNSYIEALETWVRLNITVNKLPAALVGLSLLLNEKPDHLDALIMRHDLCKKQGNLRQAAIDEYDIHALTLELGGHGVPSLSQFAKMTFYKHEPLIEGSGQVYRKNIYAVRGAFERLWHQSPLS